MKQYTLLLILSLLSIRNYAQGKIAGSYNSKTNTFETENTDYWIDYFEGNVCRISNNGLFGLIDTSGTIICPVKYERIASFRQDCAIVYLNQKFGLIDLRGKLICPPKFDKINYFKYKHAVVKLKDIYGIIDNKGCVILLPELLYIYPFSTSTITLFYRKDEEAKNNIYGWINKEGKIIMETNDQLSLYHSIEGMSLHINRRGLEICFVDSLANFISIDLPYEDLSENLRHYNQNSLHIEILKFRNGLAPFLIKQKKNHYKYGFLNKKGKIAIPPIFDKIRPFKGRYSTAKTQKYWNVIDKKGNIILRDTCDNMGVFNDKWVIINKNGLSGVLNLKGDTIIPFQYKALKYLIGDLFFAKSINKPNIDLNNKIDSEVYFASSQEYKKDIEARTLTAGVINSSLDTIIPLSYADIVYVINENDTQLMASTDTQFVYTPDLVIKSSLSYDTWCFYGHNTFYNTKGLIVSNKKNTYSKCSGSSSRMFLSSMQEFNSELSGMGYSDFSNRLKDRTYLINKKFPPPKYKIHSRRSSSVLIKKNNKYAIVDLTGKIMKQFSRRNPWYTSILFSAEE
jgi:hypothetical protein